MSRGPRHRRRNHQEIFLDLLTKRVVRLDEGGEEFMQTGAKDPVDAAIFEPRISLAGEVPAFQLLLAGKLVERADEGVIAMVQRARHVLAQDEQLGDAPGVDGIAIDVAVARKAPT